MNAKNNLIYYSQFTKVLQLLIYSLFLCQRYLSMQKHMAKLDSIEDEYFTQWIHLVPSSLPDMHFISENHGSL